MGLLVVLDIQCIDDSIGGIEPGLARVVVAVFLDAEDIRFLVLQKMDELPVERHLVVAVDVEGFGVVAHHLQTVGANFRLLDASELEVAVDVVDIQQNDGHGYQRPSEIDDNPYECEDEAGNEQVREEKAAVGDGAGKRRREEFGKEGEKKPHRSHDGDHDEQEFAEFLKSAAFFLCHDLIIFGNSGTRYPSPLCLTHRSPFGRFCRGFHRYVPFRPVGGR